MIMMVPPRKAMQKLADLQQLVPAVEPRCREAGLPQRPPGVTVVVEAAASPGEGHETVRGPGIVMLAPLTVRAEGVCRPEGAPQVLGRRLAAGFAAEAVAEAARRAVPGGVPGGDPGHRD